MLGSLGTLGDDSCVSSLEGLWLDESVLVSGNELSLVVGASVTDHDLGRVLIWHHYCWLRESAPERIWMVWLKWLLQHTCVEVLSNFVLVLGKSCNFRKSLAIKIHWLGGSVVK